MPPRRRAGGCPPVLAAVVVCAGLVLHADEQAAVLDLLRPDTRALLSSGRPVLELLEEPAVDIVIAAAVRSRVGADAFVAGFRDVERLQKGPHTPAIGRFSAPPRLEDLSTLQLEAEELEELRDCRPRRCGMKLSTLEIQEIRAAINAAGSRWQGAALDAFRKALLRRASDYQAHGRPRLMPYDDDSHPVSARAELERLLAVLQRRGLARGDVLAYLRSYPHGSIPAQSFLFWSRDNLGDAKPIVSITHAAILRRDADDAPVAVMTQVYASHYLNASMSLTTLGPAGTDMSHLIYLRVTNADVFDGALGGLIRRVVERRVKAEGPPALDAMRRKLEETADGSRRP